MKKLFTSILSLSLLCGIFSFAHPQKEVSKVNAAGDYYGSITSSMKGDTLKVALYNIIKGHTKYDYGSLEIAMKTTDRDWTLSPDENDEDPYMHLLYANYNGSTSTAKKWSTSQGSYGTLTNYVWNKEHVWAKSNGFNSSGCNAYSDLHHLRASDWKCNNTRSNNPFAEVTHSESNRTENYNGQKTNNYHTSSLFEPQDADKGDVARALFYMATRYYNGDGSNGTSLSLTTGTDSSGGKWGYLDTLLKWHVDDPVDDFEAHRNDLIYTIQGNRNPYIDHPEYARSVFKDEPLTDPDVLTNLTYTGSLTKTNYKEGEKFSSDGITVTATFKKEDSSTYTKDVTTSVSWEPETMASTTTSVTGSYTSNNVTKSITINGITVETLTQLTLSGTLTKTTYDEGDIFDPTGLVVTANYSKGSTENVTSSVIWNNGETLVANQTSVTGTYANKSVVYNGITVNEKQFTSSKIEFKQYSSEGSGLSADDIQTDLVQGKDIATITAATKIYTGNCGIRFASGSYAGSLTITLKTKQKVSNIKLNVKAYGSDSPTATIATDGSNIGTFTPTSTLEETTISNGNKEITTITISTPKKNRFYLNYVVLEVASSTQNVTVAEAIDIASKLDGSKQEVTSYKVNIQGYITELKNSDYIKISDSKVDAATSSDTIIVSGVNSTHVLRNYIILNGLIKFKANLQNNADVYQVINFTLTSYNDEAMTYAKTSYEALDDACITGPSAVTTTMWNSLKNNFNQLDAYAKEKLAQASSEYPYSDDIAHWIDRYSRIVAIGKENFMDNIYVNNLFNIDEYSSNNTLIIVLIIAPFALSSFVLLVALKKKKKHE